MWRRANILVVDDEAIVCRSCRRILDTDGYAVSIAVDGDEALDQVCAQVNCTWSVEETGNVLRISWVD